MYRYAYLSVCACVRGCVYVKVRPLYEGVCVYIGEAFCVGGIHVWKHAYLCVCVEVRPLCIGVYVCVYR